jgi:hypothetical protein
LHFFRRDLTEEAFLELLRNPGLQSDYLGFVIGRCILRTYDDDGGARRQFPVNRRYTVNLFGFNRHIDGLAYQEQDTVLAACATVALWSAFHETGELFGTAIPTPAVITRAATQAIHSVHYGRPIPQHGLRVEEMCAAIRHNGLEPEAIQSAKNTQCTAGITALRLFAYGPSRDSNRGHSRRRMARDHANRIFAPTLPMSSAGSSGKSDDRSYGRAKD